MTIDILFLQSNSIDMILKNGKFQKITSMIRNRWNLSFFCLLAMNIFPVSYALGKAFVCIQIMALQSTFGLLLAVNLEPSDVLELCPGSSMTFTCTNNDSSLLEWQVFNKTHPNGEAFVFTPSSTLNREVSKGIFSVRLISRNPLVSTATLTTSFNPQQNGTNLTCASTVSLNPSSQDIDYAVLLIEGIHACIHVVLLLLLYLFSYVYTFLLSY